MGGNSGASKNDFVAAIRVFIKAYGEDNRETIKTMTELAELLLCLPGELDAAEDYSRRAHASATKVFEYTDDHVVLQEARATLGRVHSARGRHDEAIALLGRFENAAGDREYYCASLLLAKACAAPRAEGFRGLVEEALRQQSRLDLSEGRAALARGGTARPEAGGARVLVAPLGGLRLGDARALDLVRVRVRVRVRG